MYLLVQSCGHREGYASSNESQTLFGHVLRFGVHVEYLDTMPTPLPCRQTQCPAAVPNPHLVSQLDLFINREHEMSAKQ